MGPKKAVAKEKESPVTVYGFDAVLLTQLSEGYPLLVSKNEELTKRDKTSQGVIKFLRTENATQKDKLDLLEKEIKKFKSQMSAIQIQKSELEESRTENATQKDKLDLLEKEIKKFKSQMSAIQIQKSELEASNEWLISKASQLESAESQLLQSLENLDKAYKTDKNNLESRNSSLVKQCCEEKKKCRSVESQLAEVRKRLELKNVDNKDLCSKVTKLERKLNYLGLDLFGHMENKVMVLETKLKEQKKFVLGAHVQKIIEEIKEAHKEMMSSMQKAHDLEKKAILMDRENKGSVLLELQKQVHDLRAQNYMMSQGLQNPFAQI